jgi:hypothetical protein
MVSRASSQCSDVHYAPSIPQRADSHLLNAVCAGSTFPGFASTYHEYSEEVGEEIKAIIEDEPSSMQSLIEYTRLYSFVSVFEMACCNEHIPIEIIEWMIGQGAENGVNQTLLVSRVASYSAERANRIYEIFEKSKLVQIQKLFDDNIEGQAVNFQPFMEFVFKCIRSNAEHSKLIQSQKLFNDTIKGQAVNFQPVMQSLATKMENIGSQLRSMEQGLVGIEQLSQKMEEELSGIKEKISGLIKEKIRGLVKEISVKEEIIGLMKKISAAEEKARANLDFG